MRIGIDAKWFYSGPPSGKVVINQLLKELLSDNYKDHFFLIFLNKQDERRFFPYSNTNVHLIYVKNYNNLISNAFLLPKYSRKFNLDITLFQNFGTFYSIKSIVYIHDLLYLDFPQYYSFKERVYLSILKPLAKNAKALITISKSEKNRIIQHKLGEENVYYVHHGVDEKFKPIEEHCEIELENLKKKYKLPNEFILYLGRLNIRKNINNLIKAMYYVDLPLVIVGKKDHKTEDITKTIYKLGLKDKIIFTGFLSENEIPLIYSLAKVFCFPSYAEGFGLPPLEAMASGTPVVVSETTCLPEICESAALYINPNKPKDIAKKINTLLASNEIINKFVTKGILQSKKYTWKKSANRLMDIINTTNDI